MADTIKVLGICGSLRQASYNRMALKAAGENLPPGMTLEVFDKMADIPPYNEDVKAKGFPPAVAELRAKIKAADALLFVTPEYNYSMSGVIKNAIDWASRPPEQPFDGKPVAIMGASMGVHGTSRAQYHLRQTMIFLNMLPLNKPEVMIPQAQTKFDAQGNLTDAVTKQFIADLMLALAAWTKKIKG
jgi:chromate reductase, NAD(P)H dehydrogenase (quinone)